MQTWAAQSAMKALAPPCLQDGKMSRSISAEDSADQ